MSALDRCISSVEDRASLAEELIDVADARAELTALRARISALESALTAALELLKGYGPRGDSEYWLDYALGVACPGRNRVACRACEEQAREGVLNAI